MPPVRRSLAAPSIGGKVVDHVQITEIELEPGQPTGRHVHPVPVVGYVVAGQIHFQVEGEPPRRLRAGEAFYEPAGATILHFDNASPTQPATFVALYLAGQDEHEVIRMLDPVP